LNIQIYAALVEYRLTGEHQSINFSEAASADTYRNHMKTLADTGEYAATALHKVLHSLYSNVTQVFPFSEHISHSSHLSEAKSVQASAGSSSTLINLVDVPESD
jgi:hypothetical protein